MGILSRLEKIESLKNALLEGNGFLTIGTEVTREYFIDRLKNSEEMECLINMAISGVNVSSDIKTLAEKIAEEIVLENIDDSILKDSCDEFEKNNIL